LRFAAEIAGASILDTESFQRMLIALQDMGRMTLPVKGGYTVDFKRQSFPSASSGEKPQFARIGVPQNTPCDES